MADLKPCPFCGGRADWWETESDTHRFQIVCVECCCGTDECVTEEVALKRWNTRKPMEAVVEKLENLPRYRWGMTLMTAKDYVKVADLNKTISIVRNGGKEQP